MTKPTDGIRNFANAPKIQNIQKYKTRKILQAGL